MHLEEYIITSHLSARVADRWTFYIYILKSLFALFGSYILKKKDDSLWAKITHIV